MDIALAGAIDRRAFLKTALVAGVAVVVRPLAKSQYVARTAAGLIIASIVVFIWAYASTLRGKLPAFVVLGSPAAAQRFAGFALVALLVSSLRLN